MASQSFLANYNTSNVQLKLVVYTVETSISGNWTRERADLWLQVNNASGQYWNNYSQPCGVNIDGKPVNGSCTFDARSTGDKLLIGTQDFIIVHDSDGSKAIGVSGYHNTGTGLGNASVSGTYYCDNIPRYTNFTNYIATNRTLNSIQIYWSCDSPRDWTQYSINNGAWTNAGDSVAGDNRSGNYTLAGLIPNTIYSIKTRIRRTDSGLWTESGILNVSTKDINRITSNIYNGNTDNALRVTANSASGTRCDIYIELLNADKTARIGSVIRHDNTLDTTFTANEMLSLAQYIPNANNANFRINIITKLGAADAYKDYRYGTFSIINAKPTFLEYIYEDTNLKTLNLTGDNKTFINRYSNLKVSVNSTNKMIANKYSTSIRYDLVAGDKKNSFSYDNVDVFGNIDYINAKTISLSAVDSRNNSTTVTKNITSLDYIECLIKNMKFQRKDGIGTGILVVGDGIYDKLNFGAVINTVKTIEYRRKESSETDYSVWLNIKDLFNISEGKFVNKASNEILSTNWTLGVAYDVQVRITDELSTNILDLIVDKGQPLYSESKGEGRCYGGIYDPTVGTPLQVLGKEVIHKGNILNIVYPVGKYVELNTPTSPAVLFGGTWVQVVDRILIGAGNTYTAGSTGGTVTETLTVLQIPSHNHSVLGGDMATGGNLVWNIPRTNGISNNYGGTIGNALNNGGGLPHNNLPPYIASYIWCRSA